MDTIENIQHYRAYPFKVNRRWNKIVLILAIFFSIQLMNQFLVYSGSTLERALNLPNPVFVVGGFQQSIQAFLGIFLYSWIFKQNIKELGLHTKNFKADVKYFWGFAKIWIVVIVVYIAGVFLFSRDTWLSMRAIPLPTKESMIAAIAFQSFFPGFGEEILFRGLIINLLANLIFTGYQSKMWQKVGIVIISSLYFALAHIYFSLAPFEITHFDPTQIAMALGCGMFYASIYLKTRSLVMPFLSHNFSNITSTVAGYLISEF